MRSWLDRIANERSAFLTITSLELPDCPIPLIESQASARGRTRDSGGNGHEDKDEILDELLEKVAEIRRETQRDRSILNSRESRRNHPAKRPVGSAECSRTLADLEECTRSMNEGTDYRKSSALEEVQKDCICSEISEKLRINIRKKTEVRRSSRSPSPEVTHIIRIAMKYHGQSECRTDQKKESSTGPAGPEVDAYGSGEDLEEKKEEDPETEDRSGGTSGSKDYQEKWQLRKDENCCSGVNVALDFTLNCSSVQLTSRDVSVKAGIKNK
ncbi:uncharacterized protein LOC107270111 [Cephus cinctus]|uniref:Uncharacterized protein LOC107270111 n=1 Tax=Cephus cinctus TaxID=211228 RepID=A0AAJ7RLM3_CEPCN|nr:uncharacterized protein LOC107270111 [Cephus cinctus]XP_024943209.1 uncharacterized protein LOC107270111 [Cephus cinctus]